ncbi:putative drug exporter of the RND superfamily [Agreia bicolorata]|uniref:Putative drug exporter of the RND superfamily n=1 Tax=Agreia bicolorata TaxID=110935 RepID=A0A1T4Y358_9MICO|nr:MMPL family transporter [Agreia bicolorata]SKA96267.1 putative drug exporter of the RND superfamily [Agreia bicolorata]
MATLLYSIGAFSARRHFLIIAAWLLLAVAALGGAHVLNGQMQQSVEIPGTESQTAIDMLETRFPQASGGSAKVIFEAPAGDDIDNYSSEISAISKNLGAMPNVANAADPFASGNASQISADKSLAYVSVQYDVPQTSLTPEAEENIQSIGNAAEKDGLTVSYAGVTPPAAASDLSQEAIGLGVAFVILAITFGSLLAAGMPLVTALIAVAISSGGIGIFSAFVTISSTAPVLAEMLGLAVGIDYALFIVSRHRAQLATGMAPRESVALATATAGSAVVFAGLTVIIALLGLSVVGIPFLSVMGAGAAFGVVISIVISITLLPAILGLCGKRMIPRVRTPKAPKASKNTSKKPATRAPRRPRTEETSIRHRWVTMVTRRPVITVVATVLGLGLLAVPALGLKLTVPDAGYDATGTQARVAYDLLAKGYGPGFNGPLLVTADISGTLKIEDALNALEKQFTGLADVAAVSQAVPNQALDMAIISITPSSAPDSDATKALVTSIRDMEPAFEKANGFGYMVTGQTAIAIDISGRLGNALLPFALVVVGLCIVLLTMVFRSLAVPLTATLGFLLSVGASFGVVTAVFNWGWLADPLGVEKVGPVISFMPILVMAVLFGLAMDYQVFLVTRMREDYTKTGDAHRSVIDGFTASARVVTAAALIMFSVFASFVPGGGAVLQPLAGGLAVGVLIDAFIVRMTLIPALMALLGDRAWHLPAWLDRIVPNVDLEGEKVHELLDARGWHPEASPAPAAPGSDPDGQDDPAPAAPSIEARDLVIAGLSPVDIDAEVGDVLLFAGASVAARIELLAALTGRGRPVSGHLTVLGKALPFDAHALRGQSELVLAQPAEPLTVGRYLTSQIAMDAPRGHRADRRGIAHRILPALLAAVSDEVAGGTASDGLPAINEPADALRSAGARRVTDKTPLHELSGEQLIAVDVAIALSSGRPLIAVETSALEPRHASDFVLALAEAAPADVTLAIALAASATDASDATGTTHQFDPEALGRITHLVELSLAVDDPAHDLNGKVLA